jgi:hypothetical protein
VGIGDTDPSEAKLSIDNVASGDYGLKIIQAQDVNALYVNSEAASQYAICSLGKLALGCTQDISGGYAAYFTRDLGESGSYPLVNIVDDNALNTQPALKIQQDGAGTGLYIDQNGNERALYIDSESTSYNVITTFCKYGLYIDQNLSGGRAAYFTRNLDETGALPLVNIIDNHTSNTQPALSIQQDGTGHGIDMTTAKRGLQVTSSATDDAAAWFLNSSCETGSGSALQVYSNSAHTGTRNVCKIHNDNADSTGTTALHVTNDSTGLVAEFEGAGGVKITDGNLVIGTSGKGIDFSATADGATMSSELLDDYEEGTWTPALVSGSGNFTLSIYTKIGKLITVSTTATWASDGSGGTGITISGLPFTATANGGIGTLWIIGTPFDAGSTAAIANITPSSTTCVFANYGDNAGGSNINASYWTSGSSFFVSVTYRVA